MHDSPALLAHNRVHGVEQPIRRGEIGAVLKERQPPKGCARPYRIARYPRRSLDRAPGAAARRPALAACRDGADQQARSLGRQRVRRAPRVDLTLPGSLPRLQVQRDDRAVLGAQAVAPAGDQRGALRLGQRAAQLGAPDLLARIAKLTRALPGAGWAGGGVEDESMALGQKIGCIKSSFRPSGNIPQQRVNVGPVGPIRPLV